MGKAFRWLRSLLGFKKRLAKNAGTGTNGAAVYSSHGLDANKHAIAVAAAAAAAAEAAIAAARAAAEVVRLTGANEMGRRDGVGFDSRRHLAAVVVQSAFRAYLARKALKALKGLVKLQALVRGHIVRKQSTYMLHRMQAMARIQARACAHRSYTSDSPLLSSKSSHSQHPDLASPKTFEHHSHPQGAKPNVSALKRSVSKSNPKDNNGREKSTYIGSNLLDKWIEENARNKLRETLVANECGDDEKNDKVLEVDTWKPHMNPNQNDHAFQRLQQYHNEPIFIPFDTLSTHSTKSQKPTCSPSPLDFSKVGSRKVNLVAVGHAENSPGVCSASSRPGSSSGHPNYMTYTESSQAKVRSRSAPKQRLHSDRPGTVKRFIRGHWDDDTISENGWPSHVNFSTIAYPGTDSLEKFGPFVQGDAMGYYSTYGGR